MKNITTLLLSILTICFITPQLSQAQNINQDQFMMNSGDAQTSKANSVRNTIPMNSLNQVIPNESECKMVPSYNFVICCGTNIFIENTTQGPVGYFRWEWGDGHVSFGPDPVEHSYDSRGEYYLTLTVVGSCGATSMTQLIHME